MLPLETPVTRKCQRAGYLSTQYGQTTSIPKQTTHEATSSARLKHPPTGNLATYHPNESAANSQDSSSNDRYSATSSQSPQIPRTGTRTFGKPPPITREGLRRSQMVLLRALRTCAEDHAEDLACVISCILSGFGRLNVSELRSAVAMHAYAQRSERYWIDHSTANFHAWLVSFGTMFAIDGASYVCFAVAEMPHFLSNFRIRGIDGSHRTIAMISLAFVELQASVRAHGMPLDFWGYASGNWRQHYHIAARSCISLRYERLVRRREKSAERRSLKSSPRRGSSPSLEPIQLRLQTLDIDDEAQGWASVEKCS